MFAGSLPVVKAFLAGLGIGTDTAWDLHFHADCGVRDGGTGHRVLASLHLEKGETRAVVAAAQVALLRRGVAAASARTGPEIAVKADRAIREARLDYHFAVYSREGAAAIRSALDPLPAGVRAEAAEAEEHVDPAGRGVEIYTPLHEYTLSGRGTLRGTWPAVLAMRERLREVAMLEVGEITLECEE